MGSSCSSQSSAVLNEPTHPRPPFDDDSAIANRWNQIRERHQEHRSRDEVRLAEIIALQQSLIVMEDFFQSLFGQVYSEALDPQSGGLPGPPPISANFYDHLPRVNTHEPCGICGDNFDGHHAIQLPCGHVFHHEEIEPWLKEHHCTCPVCRYELPTDDKSYEIGRLERMACRDLPLLKTGSEDQHSIEQVQKRHTEGESLVIAQECAVGTGCQSQYCHH